MFKQADLSGVNKYLVFFLIKHVLHKGDLF